MTVSKAYRALVDAGVLERRRGVGLFAATAATGTRKEATMSDQPVIRLRGVTKQYGSTRALNEVSLDILPGTVVGVLGPNGSGKTTLMGHLPGLLLPTAGTVETFGQPAAQLDDAALARIGYVSQESRMMEWLTVAETIDFARAGREAEARAWLLAHAACMPGWSTRSRRHRWSPSAAS